jgi:hypothetical protein
MREQLAQFNGTSGSFAGQLISGRTVLGWFLTLCGVGVSAWVVFAIHAAVFHPDRLGLPLQVVKAEDLTMQIPAGAIQLPPVAVTVVGYLLSVLLLAIAAKIALAMLRLGASLMLGNKTDARGQLLGTSDSV